MNFVLLFISVVLFDNSNDWSEKYFIIGPTIEEPCEVVGHCDCCTSQLLILNNRSFILNDFCEGSEYISFGNYLVTDQFLQLTFDSLLIAHEYNWEIEVMDNAADFIDTTLYRSRKPYKLQVSKCDNKILLSSETEYGIESPGFQSELERLNELSLNPIN